jgi:hypothetical protein
MRQLKAKPEGLALLFLRMEAYSFFAQVLIPSIM